MTDLVHQLREPSNSGMACKALVLDAADEIERLQTALHRIGFAMTGVDRHWQNFALQSMKLKVIPDRNALVRDD